MKVRCLPCGERAVLIEVNDLASVLSLAAAVGEMLPGSGWATAVLDVVPAARTLLVTVAASAALPAVTGWLEGVAEGCSVTQQPPLAQVVTLPVRYDGPDLDDVARHTGLTSAEVIAAHTSQTWRAAFGGFAPGFVYLVGEDSRLHVPRRATPRTGVPAGSVALAGDYAGVYPQRSPGGWQILGTTAAVLWDATRQPPALIAPGTGVRFTAVTRG
ncbi:MAG: 5-oxoprolinase subunit B family protein [Propioniciclava sp.]